MDSAEKTEKILDRRLHYYYAIWSSVLILNTSGHLNISWWYILISFFIPYVVVLGYTYIRYIIEKRKIKSYFRNKYK